MKIHRFHLNISLALPLLYSLHKNDLPQKITVENMDLSKILN